ncbi:hypothetical protein D3C77_416780 [compost metagenome]
MSRNLVQAFFSKLTLFCRGTEHFTCTVELTCSLVTLVNIRQSWTTKSIARRQITLAILIQQLGTPAPFKADRIFNVAIDRISVGIDEHQHKFCVAHATFYFKGRHSTMNQFGNMLVHEHILHRKRIFGRIHIAVLLHPVIPAARLQTFAPIAAHPKHKRAKIAIGSMYGAHIPVNEIFQLHTRRFL